MFFLSTMVVLDEQLVLFRAEVDCTISIVVQKRLDPLGELTDCDIGIRPFAVIPNSVDTFVQLVFNRFQIMLKIVI